MSEKDQGASDGPGSREPRPAVVAASGFDPSRDPIIAEIVRRVANGETESQR